jgi:hypothetical protein
MKVYMLATEEPLSYRVGATDEFGNVTDLILYATRELAEQAAEEYRREIVGEGAWVVEIVVREPGTKKCDHCGDPLTDKDRDNTDGHDTLGFNVHCETCRRPLTLCGDCWDNSDHCPECEEKREREVWCPLCDLPLVNLSSEDRRRHYLGHKD